MAGNEGDEAVDEGAEWIGEKEKEEERDRGERGLTLPGLFVPSLEEEEEAET